jgi:hypothetical protein
VHGYFDYRLQFPEEGKEMLPEVSYGYGAEPPQGAYSLTADWTDPLNGRSGHLVAGGRNVLFSDGGVIWISFEDVPASMFSENFNLYDTYR